MRPLDGAKVVSQATDETARSECAADVHEVARREMDFPDRTCGYVPAVCAFEDERISPWIREGSGGPASPHGLPFEVTLEVRVAVIACGAIDRIRRRTMLYPEAIPLGAGIERLQQLEPIQRPEPQWNTTI